MTPLNSRPWIAALLLALASQVPGPVSAHGGEDHGDAQPATGAPAAPAATAATAATAASATAAGRFDAGAPQRLPDGSLWLPKPAQHRLGVQTQLARSEVHALAVELNGRVVADPGAAGRVQASEAGRIEAGPNGRLPVLGQKVVQGQVLALLRPTASSLERGSQQAALADLDAQLAVAQRRVARYQQLEGALPQKDIDAASDERDALLKRRAAIGASVSTALALRAPVNGTVVSASVAIGQVVDARDVLFEIVDPAHLMVEALAYDAALTRGLTHASAAWPGGVLKLQFIGGARQLREQALPLLFRVADRDPPVAIGQAVKVTAQTATKLSGIALPAAALGRNAAGDTVVWLHVAPERFAPHAVRAQPLDARTVVVISGLAGGDRVVTVGASLLAQVR
jgi:multidrug efflux pump subunit AcrA (membrane-fusion protein)